jgi:hypothetical protein
LSTSVPVDFHRCTIYKHFLKPYSGPFLQFQQDFRPQSPHAATVKPVVDHVPVSVLLKSNRDRAADSQNIENTAKHTVMGDFGRPAFSQITRLYTMSNTTSVNFSSLIGYRLLSFSILFFLLRFLSFFLFFVYLC